jgi:hypothetical protein
MPPLEVAARLLVLLEVAARLLVLLALTDLEDFTLRGSGDREELSSLIV